MTSKLLVLTVLSLPAFLHVLKAEETRLSISHYIINAEILPKEQLLVSEATMIVKNPLNTATDRLAFSLAFDKVHWVKNEAGKEIQFDSRDGKVSFKTPIPPNDSSKLSIRYERKFSAYGRSGTISEKNSWLLYESNWYPQFPAAVENLPRYSFDVSITVPDTLAAVSSGALVENTDAAGKKTFRWKSDTPVFALSVSAAKYDIKEHQRENVRVVTYLYPEHAVRADSLVAFVGDALQFYEKEFGSYPFTEFKIVETERSGGYGPPGMILLSSSHVKGASNETEKRLNDFVLVHETAHQWWGGKVSHTFSGEGTGILTEGLADYSAFRFFESTTDMNERLSFPLSLAFFSAEAKGNMYELDFLLRQRLREYKPASEVNLGEREYQWASYYKGRYMLRALASLVGVGNLHRAMLLYAERFQFRNGSLKELQSAVEEVSGKKLDGFFHDWVFTNKRLDFVLSGVECERQPNWKWKTRIDVKNNGDIAMPVDVVLTTKNGQSTNARIEQFNQDKGKIEIETIDEAVSAEVDPNWSVLDANRSNNIYPRERRFIFLASTPSVSTTDYFYGPSITYGLTDGVRLGAWLTNRYPISSLRRNLEVFEWRVAAFYGVKSRTPGYSLSFSTFYGLPSNLWSYGATLEDVRGTQTQELNFGYRWRDDKTLRISLERQKLHDVTYYDARDFEQGTNTILSASGQVGISDVMITPEFSVGKTVFDGDYDFVKGSVTVTGFYPVIPHTSFRLFAGIARGTLPRQEAFYLSGAVQPSGTLFWFADPDRKISTQEHAHVTGDANLRGYVGTHARGRNALSLNSEFILPTYRVVRVFLDAGSVWDGARMKLLYDAGVGLDFGFARADFPVWVSEPLSNENAFRFRWLVEMKLKLD